MFKVEEASTQEKSGIKFNVTERDEYVIIEFELDKPLTPEELRGIKPPSTPIGKGVVLSGRAPIWLYAYLIHHYHPTTFIAVYDPRIGAIVTESHTPKYRVGDILKL
ncbi:MAG: CRISPR-associated ring nuclease Crn3/Csx3 [Candidatus Bathyarchaeia archaeon]